jgi:hypothetical protein
MRRALAILAVAASLGARTVAAGSPAADAAGGAPAEGAVAGPTTGLDLRADLSFSSFGERFSIVEKDSLEVSNELQLGLTLRWSGRLAGGLFEGENRLASSQNSANNTLRFAYRRDLLRSLRLRVTNETAARDYLPGSDFTYSNDYLRERLVLDLEDELARRVSLGLRGELDATFFRERSEFDYDFTRGDAGLRFEVDLGLAGFLRAGLDYGRQRVPDSTAIDYRRWRPALELFHVFGRSSRVSLEVFSERRSYDDPAVRPDFWRHDARADARLDLVPGWSLAARSELELERYQSPDPVYFNSLRTRGGIGVERRVGTGATLGLVPYVTVLTSDSEPAEEYRQISAEVTLEVLGLESLWLDGKYELGTRDYRKDTAGDGEALTFLDDSAVYSDFLFHHVSLFCTYEASPRWSLSLFGSYEPENHDREVDDVAAALLTLEASYRF